MSDSDKVGPVIDMLAGLVKGMVSDLRQPEPSPYDQHVADQVRKLAAELDHAKRERDAWKANVDQRIAQHDALRLQRMGELGERDRTNRQLRNELDAAKRDLELSKGVICELRTTLTQKEAAYEKDLVRQGEAQDNRHLLREVRDLVQDALGRQDLWSMASYTWLTELAELLGVDAADPDPGCTPVITLHCSDLLCDQEVPLHPDASGAVIPLSQLAGWSFAPGMEDAGWRCPTHRNTIGRL